MTNHPTPLCTVPGCSNVAALRGLFKGTRSYRKVCNKHRKPVEPIPDVDPDAYTPGDPVQFYNRITGEPYHKHLPTDPVAQAKAMADYQARLTTGHWPREADCPDAPEPQPASQDDSEKN